MKKLFSLLSLCFLQSVLPAQIPSAQSISGQVLDKNSQKPLIGARIRIKNSEPLLEVKTDVDGHFSLNNVPVGAWLVACDHFGYQPWFSDTLVIDSAREANLEILLVESLAYLSWVHTKTAAHPTKGILYYTTDTSVILLIHIQDSPTSMDYKQEILVSDIKRIDVRKKGIVAYSVVDSAAKGFDLGVEDDYESFGDCMTGLCCSGILAMGGAFVGLIKGSPKEKIPLNGEQSLYKLNRDRIDHYILAGQQ